MAREGEPLTADDARKERERRREFVEEVRERRARGDDPRPEDENRVELNDDFISRFEPSLVGEEVRDGHDCWVIQLVPRAGDLPVNRRIDTALNKSTGRLWIVKDDFGLSRVEFEMDEPVRFWGGIAGTLRNTIGRLQFTRTDEGAWVPKRIDIRLDLRIVFWNLRRRIIREWDEYWIIPETDSRARRHRRRAAVRRARSESVAAPDQSRLGGHCPVARRCAVVGGQGRTGPRAEPERRGAAVGHRPVARRRAVSRARARPARGLNPSGR